MFRTGTGWKVASGLGFPRLDESLFERIEDADFVAEIFEVSKVGGPGFGMSLETEHLFNKSGEVMQGSYGRKREIVRVAI